MCEASTLKVDSSLLCHDTATFRLKISVMFDFLMEHVCCKAGPNEEQQVRKPVVVGSDDHYREVLYRKYNCGGPYRHLL